MTSLLRFTGAALLLLATACDRPARGRVAKLPASFRELSPVSVLRIPRTGGTPQLYRVPSLDPFEWRSADPTPAVRYVLGADAEQGLVFMLDRANNLVALDLDTRRVRPKFRQVHAAAIGPDGAVYAVGTDRMVTQLVRQAPIRFRSKLQGEPRELYATMNGVLLARLGGSQPVLEVLGSDRPPTTTPLPPGAFTATALGDIVAVAADTAVVFYSASAKPQPRSIRVPGGARAAAFSPSGHLLYVVGGDTAIVVIDRFGHEVIDRIELPGRARDLRPDAQGRWLLAAPVEGDSAWVIDVGTHRYIGTIATSWSQDLPVVAAPNTLLGRRGADLVAFDLAGRRFPETGRVAGGAADFWIPVAWHLPITAPPAPVVAVAGPADTTADTTEAGDSTIVPLKVYLQLSSSQNPTWADDLVTKLRAAGLPAAVLPPKQPDEPYRVVLGPYPTREQAEETGRGLGMPSFVITIQGD